MLTPVFSGPDDEYVILPLRRNPYADRMADGMAIVADRPGAGIEWDVAAVERYRMT